MSLSKLLVVAMSAVVAVDGRNAPAASTVDVNEHNQNGTFEDADHSEVKDLEKETVGI